ncbi:CRISPR-associated endonuclease Cas3-HD [Streptomyces sp. AmelKG-D3]|nr:CRISPR-associated endonuclease Cas3-HD [Streptomyces sp. AmelKG-D3]
MAMIDTELLTAFRHLSPAARTAWGKHDRPTEQWLPLWRHMADSAAVAGRLWDEWVPENVKALVAEAFPQGGDDARQVAVFLACVHDIGKASPAFACQVDGLADRMRDAGLDMPYQKQFGLDRRMAPHGLAGQQLIQEWLGERFGWSERASGQFAVVAGGDITGRRRTTSRSTTSGFGRGCCVLGAGVKRYGRASSSS